MLTPCVRTKRHVVGFCRLDDAHFKLQVNETTTVNRLLYLLADTLSDNIALVYTNRFTVYRSNIILLPVRGCERQRTVRSKDYVRTKNDYEESER